MTRFKNLAGDLWDQNIPFIPHTRDDLRQMLKAIGVDDIEKLLSGIPKELRLKKSLDLPPRMSEPEALKELGRLSDMNSVITCFAGGGAYDHFRPAVIDTLMSRSEFYTAYTPYQPEVSQGTLQAMWEYQSLICELTGMEVANASLYCGGTALAEAAALAVRHTHRSKILTGETVHPHHLSILKTYACAFPYEVQLIPVNKDGGMNIRKLKNAIDENTAGVIVQHPNFYGILEEMDEIAGIAHSKSALLISSFDPISLGLLKTPAEYGVDIAVAEGQSLGLGLNYGGPYLGIIAVKGDYTRLIPGRLAGETVDREGRRGFVLTLQTREQHIRRDKATSNVCTNQALCALSAAIFLALIGKAGIKEMAEQSLQKAHYLAKRITQETIFKLKYPKGHFFKEFLLTSDRHPAKKVIDALAGEKNLLLGPSLGRFYPGVDEHSFLVAVTEMRSKEEMELLVEALRKFD